MAIWTWLAGFGITQNSGHLLVNGSFCGLITGEFLDILWTNFGFLVFMKVVGICLNFPLIKIQVIWTFLDQVMVIYVTTIYLVIFVQVSLPNPDLA